MERPSLPAPATFFFLALTAACLLHAPGSAFMDIQISSTLNPTGSGARALGMGGAFIGIADDATAASWNPAGLIQLETPEVSLVSAWNKRRETADYTTFPEASTLREISVSELNYFSLAFPVTGFGRNLTAALNYQQLFDLSRNNRYQFHQADSSGFPPYRYEMQIQDQQNGSLSALSPALAIQATPSLSLGFTLNFYDSGLFRNQWKIRQTGNGQGVFDYSSMGMGDVPFSLEYLVEGRNVIEGTTVDCRDPFHWQNVNFHVGLLWAVNPVLTIGAVFKSPFEIKTTRWVHSNAATVTQGLRFETPYTETSQFELTLPMVYGVGLALRISDQFSFDLDICRTHWESYILRDAAGRQFNPATGLLLEESGKNSPTTQIRLGGEYLIIGDVVIIPLRAGIFYDPEPAANGIDDFWGVGFGTGLAQQGIAIDMAYQFRYGNNVRHRMVGGSDFTEDVAQHTLYLSVIFHY